MQKVMFFSFSTFFLMPWKSISIFSWSNSIPHRFVLIYFYNHSHRIYTPMLLKLYEAFIFGHYKMLLFHYFQDRFRSILQKSIWKSVWNYRWLKNHIIDFDHNRFLKDRMNRSKPDLKNDEKFASVVLYFILLISNLGFFL